MLELQFFVFIIGSKAMLKTDPVPTLFLTNHYGDQKLMNNFIVYSFFVIFVINQFFN